MHRHHVSVALHQDAGPLRLIGGDQQLEAVQGRPQGGRAGHHQLLRHRDQGVEAEGDRAAGSPSHQGLHRRLERRGEGAEGYIDGHGPSTRRRQGVPMGKR